MSQPAQQEEDVFTGKIDLKLWKQLAVFALPYKRYMAATVTLALLVAGCDIALPLLTGRIIKAVTTAPETFSVWSHVLPYGVVFAVLACCVFGFIWTNGRVVTGVSTDIRTASFHKLQDLPFAYYDKRAVGWLMARLTSDCSSLSRVMAWGLLDMVWGTCLLVGVSITMFVLNWKLALIVMLVAPVLLGVSWWFQVRLLKSSRAIRKANSIVTGAYNEGITGVRTSKSMVREERNLEEFSVLTGTMYGHSVKNALYSALFLPTVLSICSIGVGLALWQGGVSVIAGTLTLPVLIVFIQYAGNIAGPAQELANTLTMIQGAQASAERICGLLNEEVTIKDSDEVRARMGLPPQGDASDHTETGRAFAVVEPTRTKDGLAIDGYPSRIRAIEFRNVSFGYKPGQKVLADFNLTVHAGQTIALVGPTGGGKSTIVSLLCRFYEPTEGEVLIDGVDYRKRSLHWLQSQLGMVLQQPHLFSGTIRENIRYGRLDATDDEIVEAAKMTNAHTFITRFKDGYDAAVGEGGNQLSTGQKQLITLSRAVLADPQIFVMDEATSSVDTQTERDIQNAVEKVLEGRISFVIAHRLSTIKNADLILVIDGGRVVEQGSHHDLINQRGRYYELYTNQFTHEKEEELMHAGA
jgi:ATP-binding cassette subfamily B protein